MIPWVLIKAFSNYRSKIDSLIFLHFKIKKKKSTSVFTYLHIGGYDGESLLFASCYVFYIVLLYNRQHNKFVINNQCYWTRGKPPRKF
jgi:hypothetical protein